MSNLSRLLEEKAFYTSVNDFMSTYQELAALQMQRVRDSILQTRRYMDGLSDVFIDVRQSHYQKIKELVERNKKANKDALTGKKNHISLSSLKKNGKSLVILISPDSKFSGDITRKVFSSFKDYFHNSDREVALVGIIGERLFKQSFPNKNYKLFTIPEKMVGFDELVPLIKYAIDYEQVDIFYSRFYSLINQEPVTNNITGDTSFFEQTQAVEREKRNFLFEPPLEEMLEFFEIQVFSSLIRQALHESYLANLGSRIITLDAATQNVSAENAKLDKQYTNMQRYQTNRKQRERIAGMDLWK